MCKKSFGYLEVRIVELVGNVPTQHQELSTFQKNRVEEAEREEKLLVPETHE